MLIIIKISAIYKNGFMVIMLTITKTKENLKSDQKRAKIIMWL